MRAWWSKTRRGNWGDDFNVPLLRHLTGATPTHHHGPGKLLAVGSILHKLDDGDAVWGSGLLSPQHACGGKRGVRWFAVRGPHTRAVLQDCGYRGVPEIYGDPGLLVSQIYAPSIEKRYRLGIVPHYVDYAGLKHLRATDVHVIDIRSGLEQVVSEVTACDQIQSSSLHGIIIAEAYSIPATWLRVDWCSRIIGGEWKFRDYYAGTGRMDVVAVDIVSGGSEKMCCPMPPPDIDLHQLVAAFPKDLP